jgi:hypothetical protein
MILQDVPQRTTRRLVTSALLFVATVALCAAPAAGARAHERGEPLVTPAKGKWMGESWAQLYSLPVSAHPWFGNGDQCLTLARDVIQASTGGPCTIKQGTTFTLFISTAWSNVEDPFPETQAEQRAVALAVDQGTVEIALIVDDQDPIQIRNRRFERFSQQRTVLLPADNFLGVPGPQTVTLTAHGWGAAIRKLSPGGHTIVLDALLADGSHWTIPHYIDVVR